MGLFRRLIRGYQHISTIFKTYDCPICLDEIKTSYNPRSPSKIFGITTLSCNHKYCTDCIQEYVERKIREQQVEDDQLTCPVVNCRHGLTHGDIKNTVGENQFKRYLEILTRKRNERHPDARWCPRPGCGELILPTSTQTSFKRTFECPKCHIIGCFNCGKVNHWFWFCKAKEDPSYTKWEKSVGNRRAVRSCPRCQMRIWKNEGCNHMTCTGCRNEFCWVCGSKWDSSHYACYEMLYLSDNSPWSYALQRILGYLIIFVIIFIISVFGFYTFVGCYGLVFGLVFISRRLMNFHEFS